MTSCKVPEQLPLARKNPQAWQPAPKELWTHGHQLFSGGTPRAARVGRRLLPPEDDPNSPDYSYRSPKRVGQQLLRGKYGSVAVMSNRGLASRCHHYCCCTTFPAELLLLLRPHITRKVGLTIRHATCIRDTAQTLLCTDPFCLRVFVASCSGSPDCMTVYRWMFQVMYYWPPTR